MPFMDRPPRIIAACVAGGLALLLLVGGCDGADSASSTTATTAATTGTTATTATTIAATASPTTTAPEPESAILFPFQDEEGLWGFMDARGDTVIDARFEMVDLLAWKSGDRLPVRLEGRVCLIDRTGAVVAEADPRVDGWWPFLEGGPIPVTFAGGQELGLMDLEGRVLVEPRYDESLQFFYWHMQATGGDAEAGTPLPVAENEQFGFVDSTGALVIPLQYDLALWFSEGLAAAGELVSAGDGDAGQALLGYIDTEGNTIIEPQFAAAGPFSEGLAAAVPQGGDKIGFIDRTGRWAIEPQFEWNSSWMLLSVFSEGLARMLRDNLIGYIDASGRWAIEPQLPLLETMEIGLEIGLFSDGLASVLVAQGEEKCWGPPVPKRWGYIDPTGTVVIPAQFTGAGRFEGGLAMVSITERGEGDQGTDLAGYIDTAGNWVKQWVPIPWIARESSENGS